MKRCWILFLLFMLAHPTLIGAESQRDSSVPHKPKLRVAVSHDPPYTIKAEDGTWTGFNVDLWSQVALERKWSYELVEMTFADILRALHQGTIDLAIVCLFQTPEREKLFDFSSSLGSTRLALATLPNRMEHPWLSALRIFLSWSTLKVIGILMLLLLMAGFVFWLVERKRNPEHFGGGFIKGISSGIYWVGSTLASGVCFGIDLKSLPGRLAGLFWMFLCAIALSAFIASLTSSLTLTKLATPVIELNSLKTMRIGTVKGTMQATLLKRVDAKRQLFDEEQEVVEALINKQIDGFFFDEATLNYYATRVHRPPLSVYPIKTRRLQIAFGIPDGSPLRKELNASLLSLMNEPYWDFLAERYGLSETSLEQPVFGRKQNR